MTTKRPYIPIGVDQQGRLPMTEREPVPDDLHCAAGIVWWALASSAIWALLLWAIL